LDGDQCTEPDAQGDCGERQGEVAQHPLPVCGIAAGAGGPVGGEARDDPQDVEGEERGHRHRAAGGQQGGDDTAERRGQHSGEQVDPADPAVPDSAAAQSPAELEWAGEQRDPTGGGVDGDGGKVQGRIRAECDPAGAGVEGQVGGHKDRSNEDAGEGGDCHDQGGAVPADTRKPARAAGRCRSGRESHRRSLLLERLRGPKHHNLDRRIIDN